MQSQSFLAQQWQVTRCCQHPGNSTPLARVRLRHEGLAEQIGGAEGRIRESTHAILYALDAQTGDELWSSGDQITSWNHFSGLTVANGRVYIGTFDGVLYCFGAPSLAPLRNGRATKLSAKTFHSSCSRARVPERMRCAIASTSIR